MAGTEGTGHGKIILLGEHAVVFGRPALAAAIPRGCRAEATFAAENRLSVSPWGVHVRADQAEPEPDRELLRRAFAEVCQRLPEGSRALCVEAVMEIPGGAGLGGSAALSVAAIRACHAALGVSASDDEVIALSLAWERVFHGNPSGIDSAMATRGGLALYRRGEPLAPVSAGGALALVVANSGEHGSTHAMVASVGRQHARDPIKTDQIFDAIAAVVQNGKTAIEAGEHARLGQLMDLNQTLLNTLMLSTSTLEAMCQAARAAGALGAKLTGGGGGGCMIALGRDAAHAEVIAEGLRTRGHDAFVVEVT